MYAITAKRLISGLVLRPVTVQRLAIAGHHEIALSASGSLTVTSPICHFSAVQRPPARSRPAALPEPVPGCSSSAR